MQNKNFQPFTFGMIIYNCNFETLGQSFQT